MKLADGFEKAFVGSSISAFNREQVAIYDYEECIAVLIQQDMSEEDAVEHFQYNVIGSWVGEDTPIFINMHRIKDVDDYLEE
tara:strand:+ start:169 stop:414 length:246 start_codon:yes stop_codon:yes gene_type:complete